MSARYFVVFGFLGPPIMRSGRGRPGGSSSVSAANAIPGNC